MEIENFGVASNQFVILISFHHCITRSTSMLLKGADNGFSEQTNITKRLPYSYGIIDLYV